MTEPVRLVSPLVRVRRTGVDGTTEIQTANPDLIRWDETRARHKWPTFQEAPFLWLTFISWAAARRQALIGPDVTWEQWKADAIEVQAVDLDAESENGTPTQPGLEPG